MEFLDLRISMESERMKVKSSWGNAVVEYAIELLNHYEENHGRNLECLSEESLLRGAPNWERYSAGAFSLVSEVEIAKRVCSPTQLYIYDGGMKPPVGMRTLRGIGHSGTFWCEVQAYALKQACDLLLQEYGKLKRRIA